MISKKNRKARIDQLKTMIILSAGKRLPHLEKEIFADWNLSRKYLQMLVSAHSNEIYINKELYRSVSYMAYVYAVNIMKERWYNAESIIENGSYNFYYGYTVHMDIKL